MELGWLTQLADFPATLWHLRAHLSLPTVDHYPMRDCHPPTLNEEQILSAPREWGSILIELLISQAQVHRHARTRLVVTETILGTHEIEPHLDHSHLEDMPMTETMAIDVRTDLVGLKMVCHHQQDLASTDLLIETAREVLKIEAGMQLLSNQLYHHPDRWIPTMAG